MAVTRGSRGGFQAYLQTSNRDMGGAGRRYASQRNDVATARKLLDAHQASNPDYNVYEAIYTCARACMVGLEQFILRSIPTRVFGPRGG